MSTFELIDIRFIEKVQSNTVMVEQYCISTRIHVFECVWLSSPHCSHTLAGCIYFFLTCVSILESGDDTRSWAPPFCENESTYFLSINRNKKVFASYLTSYFYKKDNKSGMGLFLNLK